MPTVEDYFDDDTDLPLPSSSKPRALPDTGLKGALLEEISDNEDDMDFGRLAEQSRGIFGEGVNAPPPQSTGSGNGKGKLVERDNDNELRPSTSNQGGPNINPNTPMGGFMGDMLKLQAVEDERLERLKKQFGNANVAKDPSVYKGWNTVYPLYFDAKVSINDGRRVPKINSVWWPQATQIAQACRVLGLPSVLEPDRCHPADWENPGRVKVQIVKDGKFLNPIIKNRTQLYKHLSDQIKQRNPDITYNPSNTSTKRSNKLSKSKETSSKKLKDQSKSKPKSNSKKGKTSTEPSKPTIIQHKLPTKPSPPPQPIPTLDDRLPLHSPIIPAGVALSAIKRDIQNEKEAKKNGTGNLALGGGNEEGGGGGKEKGPKMKRVVVRGKR